MVVLQVNIAIRIDAAPYIRVHTRRILWYNNLGVFIRIWKLEFPPLALGARSGSMTYHADNWFMLHLLKLRASTVINRIDVAFGHI